MISFNHIIGVIFAHCCTFDRNSASAQHTHVPRLSCCCSTDAVNTAIEPCPNVCGLNCHSDKISISVESSFATPRSYHYIVMFMQSACQLYMRKDVLYSAGGISIVCD